MNSNRYDFGGLGCDNKRSIMAAAGFGTAGSHNRKHFLFNYIDVSFRS